MTTHTGDTTTAVTRLMHEDADRAQLTEQEILDLLGPHGDDWKNFGQMRAIGLGGVGEVFSASEPGLRRYMAVKVLRSEYRSRRNQVETLIREARITAQIEHPNIVPVHQIGYSSEAGVYFTMKEIAGRDLRTIIRALKEKKSICGAFYSSEPPSGNLYSRLSGDRFCPQQRGGALRFEASQYHGRELR
ncbi:MAG: protein kinase [Lentisphaeria bacterium]|nr:protein kinase [Lentisphaeria bacterium]